MSNRSIQSLGIGILVFLAAFTGQAHSGLPLGEPAGVGVRFGTAKLPIADSSDPQPASKHVWLGADGKPFPLQSDQELLEFLRTAEVIERKRIREGINRTQQLLLEKDGMRLRAAFRVVEVQKPKVHLDSGKTHLNFRDDYRFEVAAYRLSRLLGLDNVPPTIERRIGREDGSLQVWMEGAISQTDLTRKGLKSPHSEEWGQQVQTMRLFDQLISNHDRNLGNILIDANRKLWMIDHTRSFGPVVKPARPGILISCQRTLWENLQRLDKKKVKEEMNGVLTGVQVNALMARRDRIVAHFRDRISRLGEAAVLR